MDVLKYLHENGCPWDKWTCCDAAERGHLDVLKYAHENGCPWPTADAIAGLINPLYDPDVCKAAAKGGYLDVLKYARANGCPWDRNRCLECAKGEQTRAWILSQPDDPDDDVSESDSGDYSEEYSEEYDGPCWQSEESADW